MFGKTTVTDPLPATSPKPFAPDSGTIPIEHLSNYGKDDNASSILSLLIRKTISINTLLRFIDPLSLPEKLTLLDKLAKNRDKTIDESNSDLNNRTLFLFEGRNSFEWNNKFHKTTDLFPKNKENEWPVLVVTSNSNLVSKRVFAEGFEVAKKLVPQVTGEHENDNIIVMGTYFSRDHALVNASDTVKRLDDLKHDQDNILELSPAAHIQAGQLLNFLVERDTEGNVITKVHCEQDNDGNVKKEHKPLLRDDADKIMKRIIGYGYSGGHLTNKDTFRTLRDFLEKGHVMVKYVNGTTIYRQSSKADAQKIIPNARLIGIAGADSYDERNRNMPKEVNFVSYDDRIIALHGRDFRNSDTIIEIKTPSMFTIIDKKLDMNIMSDHDQLLYLKAILMKENENAILKAKERLSHPPQHSIFRQNPARQR